MTERPDNQSPETKSDAAAKKQWIEPEMDVVPASDTGAFGNPLGGVDFGSNHS
jgi:hypothetical protein